MRILAPDKHPAVRSVGKNLSVTLEDVTFEWLDGNNHHRLIVPTGFLFDGASIPWALWSALRLAPHGAMDGPALAHDFIYHHKGDMPPGSYQLKTANGWFDMLSPLRRDVADDMLKALVVHFKAAGEVRASLVWVGVRVGGWYAWRRDDDGRKLAEFDTVFEETMERP